MRRKKSRNFFSSFFRSKAPTFLGAFAALTALSVAAFATDDVVRATRKIESFDLAQVRLLPSPFQDAQEKDVEYLLSVEPDRLLAKFRIFADLEPKAEPYDGWESLTIAGHSLGHYLAAVSSSYASTGDERFKQISDYIVDELAECQATNEDGLIAATANFRDVFAEVSRGEIRSQGFDLNGLWVPWYVWHKIANGLLDAYRYCDNPKALEVARKFGDWGIETTKNLSDEDFQRMMNCEFGGTNDAYYDLYAATGDEKYLKAGDRFYHLDILKPLSEGRDELRGRHANTQIPKLVGLARRFELAGDGLNADKTTEFFWDRVVGWHTYANGGNSNGEHFGEPGVLSNRFSDSSSETCNTRNMLRLTKKLYMRTGDKKYLDYFERALYNHILTSIDVSENPEKLFTYFIPLTRGGFRTYSDRFHTWSCCHGTGMENHVQYNGVIYYRETTDDGDVLYLNLAIPSTLDWAEKGVKATILPDMTVKIEAENPTRLVVKARVPNNCRIADANAEAQDGYFVVGTDWNAGATTVSLPFVADWKIESTPDDENCVAFFRGPFLYAGDLGSIEKRIVASFAEEEKTDGVRIPIIVSNSRDLSALVDDAAPEIERSFAETPDAKLLAARPDVVSLVPFYRATQRYEVYFDYFTEDFWRAEQEKFVAERELQARIAAATVDSFQPGEMQPERDCEFNGKNSEFGEFNGRKWRDARNGGFIEFSLNVDPETTCVLSLTYWGDDVGFRVFDILVDGEVVATKSLEADAPGRFYDETYRIPNPNKKDRVRVRLQAKPNAMAGGIFFAKTLRVDGAE